VSERQATLRELEWRVEQVRAWCERAIAVAWDCGRIGYSNDAELPFAGEVDAILRGASGRAGARLQAARARADHLTGIPLEAGSAWAELCADLELSDVALEILGVVVAPLLAGTLARAYAIASNDPGRPMCDEQLVHELLSHRGAIEIAAELEDDAALVRHGVLSWGRGQRPFRELRPHPVIVRRLGGLPIVSDDDVQRSAAVGPLLGLLLAESSRRQVLLAQARMRKDRELRLVVRGRRGAGRRTVATALAAASGRSLGMIDVAHFGAEPAAVAERLRELLRSCALRGWIPCVSGLECVGLDQPGVGERLREVLRAHRGAVVIRGAADAQPPLEPGYVTVDLVPLGGAEREAFARACLESHGLDASCAAEVVRQFVVPPGLLAWAAARVGEERTVLDPTERPTVLEHLGGCLRQQRTERLAKTATRITKLPSLSDLVLPPDCTESVREIIGRIRQRQQVFEGWGLGEKITTARGVSVLLHGSPGTGKTMIAGAVAREVGADLYRVDLSRILSKWIGETEANLGALFDAAEDGQSIILFDEADALFTKRTEVKSSTDRYANAAVNYLLMRLDSFEGTAFLTTNLEGSIDRAFRRRISISMHLPFPDESTREKLWRVHVPESIPRAGDLDLRALAERHEMSGGYIRNCVLRAAFLAAGESVPLSQAHLERAVQLEYRSAGRMSEKGILE
jgi:hypothetical protein